ncbi:MAG: DUF6992 family protein [Myxococcota bacterium]
MDTPEAVEVAPEAQAQAARASRGHFTRLAVFGGFSLAGGGVAMALSRDEPALLHFGLHNAIGGASNVAFGLLALPSTDAPRTFEGLARTRETMALNVGLDAGYVAAGLAMGLLGQDEHPAIGGAGWAIAVQGAGLLVLDAIYWRALPR